MLDRRDCSDGATEVATDGARDDGSAAMFQDLGDCLLPPVSIELSLLLVQSFNCPHNGTPAFNF